MNSPGYKTFAELIWKYFRVVDDIEFQRRWKALTDEHEKRIAELESALAKNAEIIAAAIALVPHLENGWDECDEEGDQRAANGAVNRLIAGVKALQAEPQGKEG